MQGFWDCTVSGSKSFMNVAPGVTNSGSGINSGNDRALGTAWGKMIVDLGSWISSKGYGTQLAALGSADFEPGYGSPSHALNWAAGFISTGAYYYDFGSADGCSSSGCNNGWSLANEYQLAWGNPHAYATPQIYNSAMATEWQLISNWARPTAPPGRSSSRPRSRSTRPASTTAIRAPERTSLHSSPGRRCTARPVRHRRSPPRCPISPRDPRRAAVYPQFTGYSWYYLTDVTRGVTGWSRADLVTNDYPDGYVENC